jgi:hypothetical protein
MQAANSPRPSESSLAFNYELRLESSGVRENRSSRLRIRSGPAPPAPRFLWRILCFLIFQAMINFDLRCRAAELAKAPFANPGPSTICNIGSIAMATQQTLPPLPPPKWVVDLKSPLPRPSISASSIPDPPGFSRKAGKGVGTPKHPIHIYTSCHTNCIYSARKNRPLPPPRPSPPKPTR